MILILRSWSYLRSLFWEIQDRDLDLILDHFLSQWSGFNRQSLLEWSCNSLQINNFILFLPTVESLEIPSEKMIENKMHKIVYFSLSQIRRHVQNQKHYFTNHHNTVSKKYQKFFVKSNCFFYFLFLYFFSPILTTRLLHHWILSIPWVKNMNNFSWNQMVLFIYFFNFLQVKIMRQS